MTEIKEKELIKSFAKTFQHFFPEIWGWVEDIPDPRDIKKTVYAQKCLVLVGLLLFVLRLGSRRQMNFRLNSKNLLQNLQKAFAYKAETIPHGDTIKNYFCGLAFKYMEKLRSMMIKTLIRMKCFEKYRFLNKYYLIAIDGTQHLTFKDKHCDHCLRRELKSGEILYYHMVLEAKLVVADGMALSIATEFIENIDPNAKKQDCELKGAYRLLKRLKSEFPQLEIALAMDGLFANQQIIGMVEEYGWKYIITFKEGSIPNLFAEFEAMLKDVPENRLVYRHNKTKQTYCWAKGLEYNEHSVNVLSCNEIKKRIKKEKGKLKEVEKETKFVWLTNLEITDKNCFKIANRGGRQRWAIENQGFNTQKNGGFNLEHAYSRNPTAIKNFYLLLQIAHMLVQLMEFGLLNKKKVAGYGGSCNVAIRLLEELKYFLLNSEDLLFLNKKIRVSFDTS